MIVTTNLTNAEMARAQDIRAQRVYERVLETCFPVLLDGPSRRMQGAGERHRAMKKLIDGAE